jgi:uncharacterized protein with ParB-like and HNH nuclease domain
MFQTPITINEAVNNIHRKKYLLPSIQRELVWSTEQIEKLFDSLMRGYPIGSFLFWYVEKQRSKNYQFYEFMRNYHEKDSRHNEKANISGEDDITAILDGQQRLTSLYIGLKGTHACKLPRKRWDNPAAYPSRELYLNLLQPADDHDLVYDFKFLTKEESAHRTDNIYWFKVGEILNLEKQYEVNNYLIKNGLLQLDSDKAQRANETLFNLHDVIYKRGIINYYLESDPDLDKVLHIFVRVNSGGTPLSYSDILLSMATAQWQLRDARDEIIRFVDDVNKIGDGFNIDKDFVLKTCLVLSDFQDIGFKVTNFNRKNMIQIEENWERISKSILQSMSLSASYGFNRDTLTSYYSVIPIAYYLLKRGLPENIGLSSRHTSDRQMLHKWMLISLLKRFFGGVPDNVLKPIREIIKNADSECFPLEEIIENFKGETKTLTFDDDEIANLFSYQHGQSYTFQTLSVLYPTLDYRNRFHMDHIFPKSVFTKAKLNKLGITDVEKIEFYTDNYNCLANLQLLEGTPNLEKSSIQFKEWMNQYCRTDQEQRDYMSKHYIPDIDWDIRNFEQFIKERTKLMKKVFYRLLTHVSPSGYTTSATENRPHPRPDYDEYSFSQRNRDAKSSDNKEPDLGDVNLDANSRPSLNITMDREKLSSREDDKNRKDVTRWNHGKTHQGGEIDHFVLNKMSEEEIVSAFERIHPEHGNIRQRVRSHLRHLEYDHKVKFRKGPRGEYLSYIEQE